MKTLALVAALLPGLHLGLAAPLDTRSDDMAPAVKPAATYAECQRKTCHPLDGCPPNTIFVSQKSKRAHFSSIQAAINSLPDTDVPAVILIAPGNYTEQLNVTRHGALTLLGMSDRPHEGRLYADLATDLSSPAPENEVQVWHNAANYQARFPDNAFTSVLSVGPTLNATLTGAGPTGFAVPEGTPFGNVDFRAYNIDFRNDEFPRANGPAHAVGVSRANAGFYSCGLYSYQDTVSLVPVIARPPSSPPCTNRQRPLTHSTAALRRQARKRLLPRQRHRRPDRLPLRLRHRLGRPLDAVAAQLRRRHHRLEGHQHDLPQQVRRLRRRRQPGPRRQRLHRPGPRRPLPARPPLERPAPLRLQRHLPRPQRPARRLHPLGRHRPARLRPHLHGRARGPRAWLERHGPGGEGQRHARAGRRCVCAV